MALGLVALGGCLPVTPSVGTTGESEPRERDYPPLQPFYRVTVVDGAIASRRPDQKPWHETRPDKAWMVIGGVAGMAIGQPELGMTLGEMVAGDGNTFGPAPRVELVMAGTRYETTALPSTFQPRWDEAFLLDARRVDPGEDVLILVRDGLDGSVIATTQMPVGELVAKPGHTLTGMGSVPMLNLRVEPTTPAMSAREDAWVPAEGSAAVDVVGGDIIAITASGSACVKEGLCFGPEGDRTDNASRRRYNVKGFERAPHGELVGRLSGMPIRIGAGQRYRVPRTGVLELFINDADSFNNFDGWDVEVVANPDLTPPAAPEPESPDAATSDSAGETALRELQGLADEMCACEDKACAEHVAEAMMALGKRHEDTRATEEEMTRAKRIATDITACMTRAMEE